MILLIDNYDSFTYNLVHLIGAAGPKVEVARNDTLTVDEALGRGPAGIVLSPGPCSPDEAGICVDLATAAFERKIPLFGVCLGHQSIIKAAGGEVVRAGRLMHGRTSMIRQTGRDPLFADIPELFEATRYHSLVGARTTLPDTIDILAEAEDDGEIMAIRWRGAPVWGVQYHPESIASEHGPALIRGFLHAVHGMEPAA